jgi:hypothetical protein
MSALKSVTRFGRLFLVVSTVFGFLAAFAALPAAAWSPDAWDTPVRDWYGYASMDSAAAAISASGDGAVVFGISYLGPGDQLFQNIAATLWDGNKWSDSTNLIPGYDEGRSPSVGMDANGSALVVWQQDTQSVPNAGYATHQKGAGWVYGGLFADNVSVGLIDVALDVADNGSAHALWSADQGSGSFALRDQPFVPGSGWRASQVVAYASGGLRFPTIATDSNGTAVAIWVEGPAGGLSPSTVFASVKPVGQAWSASVPISNGTGYIEKPASLSVSPTGEAFAAWYENTPGGSHSFFNRWVPGTLWQNATMVSGGSSSSGAVAAADGHGGAAVMWEGDGGEHLSLFSPSTGLQFVGTLPSAGGAAFGGAGLGYDAMGTLRMAWVTQRNSASTVLALEYQPGPGLGFSDLIVMPTPWSYQNGNTVDVFAVATSAEGPALAAWVGTYSEPLEDPLGGPLGGMFFDGYFGVMPWDRTPPSLSVTVPANGSAANRSAVWVGGTTEAGARVTVAGVPAAVDASGAFGILVPLVDGVNALEVVARDANRNEARLVVLVNYSDPAARQIEQLEGALASQNATLLAALAQTNASLLGQLAAQNDSLIAFIAATNMTLLGQLAANNAALDARISATNSTLASQLAEMRTNALATDARSTQTATDLADAQAKATALSGQVSTLSLVAGLALLAAIGSIGWTVLERRRQAARRAAKLQRKEHGTGRNR